MPGLFGLACLDPRVELEPHRARAALDAMASVLCATPFAAARTWIDPNGRVAVGSVGLTDLLLSPMPGRDGSPCVFAYGSILENARLAADTAAGTFNAGDESLRSLRGSWALIHRDSRSGRLVLAADRKASIPLLYARLGDILVFAPEQKALLVFEEISRELDPAGAANLLSSGWLHSGQTLLRGVRRIPGGHILNVTAEELDERAYWRFTPGETAGRRMQDVERRMASHIREAVSAHLGDPETTLIFLSGGADSRAILGGAIQAAAGGARALRTVTWGIDRGVPGSDVDIACRIAERTGVRHMLVARETRDYGAAFREVNSIVEGFCDVAAFHPHEYRLMHSLRAHGFRRVLRGDEAFGWSHSVQDLPGAAIQVGIRRFGDLEGAVGVVRPEHRGEWIDAAAQAWEALLAPLKGVSPDAAKDRLYFDQRLQCMLGPCAYYKHAVFDHRNVLLHEPILDLMSEVPDRERLGKRLYLRAAHALAPDLFGTFPLATRSSLEDWSQEIAGGGSVREFLDEELGDRSSPVWNVLDIEAVHALARTAINRRPAQTPGGWRAVRSRLRKVAYTLLPGLSARAHAHRAAHRLGVTEALLRSMVLKDWVDRVARTTASVSARPVAVSHYVTATPTRAHGH